MSAFVQPSLLQFGQSSAVKRLTSTSSKPYKSASIHPTPAYVFSVCCSLSSEESSSATNFNYTSNLSSLNTSENNVPVDVLNAESDNAAIATEAILRDISSRPEYYINITGTFVGICLTITVFSAVIGALNNIPFVADMLKIVGLGYVFWFLQKFLTTSEARDELKLEIDEFVSSVRGDQVKEAVQINTEPIVNVES